MPQPYTPPHLQPGTTLTSASGKTYTLQTVLGHNGHTITYMAYTKVPDYEFFGDLIVCVIELYPTVACKRDFASGNVTCSSAIDFNALKSDFVKEAGTLISLARQSRYIPKVTDILEANGTAYFVMQYVRGRSLKEFMEVDCLDYGDKLNLFTAVVGAVSTLHQNQVCHLNLNPSNIIITSDRKGRSWPIIIGFGHSKNLSNVMIQNSRLAIPCIPVQCYVPFEQLGLNEILYPSVDVYSLGAIAFELFGGVEPMESLPWKSQERDQAIDRLPIEEHVRKIMKRAMSIKPSDRYSSASDMLASLRDISTGAERDSLDKIVLKVQRRDAEALKDYAASMTQARGHKVRADRDLGSNIAIGLTILFLLSLFKACI